MLPYLSQFVTHLAVFQNALSGCRIKIQSFLKKIFVTSLFKNYIVPRNNCPFSSKYTGLKQNYVSWQNYVCCFKKLNFSEKKTFFLSLFKVDTISSYKYSS